MESQKTGLEHYSNVICRFCGAMIRAKESYMLMHLQVRHNIGWDDYPLGYMHRLCSIVFTADNNPCGRGYVRDLDPSFYKQTASWWGDILQPYNIRFLRQEYSYSKDEDRYRRKSVPLTVCISNIP